MNIEHYVRSGIAALFPGYVDDIAQLSDGTRTPRLYFETPTSVPSPVGRFSLYPFQFTPPDYGGRLHIVVADPRN